MQKKADGKKIRESKALNQLYREVKIWTMGIPDTEEAISKNRHILSRLIKVKSVLG
jgi:hypothetical protein